MPFETSFCSLLFADKIHLSENSGIKTRKCTCLGGCMRLVALLFSIALLSACGGGGGGSGGSTSTASTTCTPFLDSFGRSVACTEMNALSGANLPFVDTGGASDGSGDAGGDGSAGDGAPIANTELQFTDATGKVVKTRTDANGYYRISLRGMKAPLVATVLRDSKPWKSMLVEDIVRAPFNRKFYTINLTGLTDYVASEVAKKDGLANPDAITPAAVTRQKDQIPSILTSLNTSISSQIAAVGLDSKTFNALSTPFVAAVTDSSDKLLESVVVARDTNGGFTVVTPKYSVNPSNPTVAPNASVDLSANFAASFSVTGGNANGTLTSTGAANVTYKAPDKPGVYQVIATATADPSIRASASITVSSGTGWRVSGTPRIAPSTSTAFTAYFNDVAATANWTIEGDCGTCSLSSTGVFTAGTRIGTVTIRGTNPSTPSQSATASLTVASEVVLNVSTPATATLGSADMLNLFTSISPAGVSPDVNWSTGPGSSAGSVITVDYYKGYVPPTTAGSYKLTASSVADPAKTATVSVQVTQAPAVALTATSSSPSGMRFRQAAAVLSDGRILYAGGQRDRQSSNALLTTEVFNPSSGAFSAGPALAKGRVQPEAISLDANRVLVSGGKLDYQTAYDDAEIVNLSTGISSAPGNAMSARRINHRMLMLSTGPNKGRVLVLGGFNGPVPYGQPTWQASASADLFDPQSNLFSAQAVGMKTSRGNFTATELVDGRILIVGGYQPEPGAGALSSAEIYDPVSGAFTFTGSMTVARYGHTATRLADGKVLIVGGENNSGDRSSAEIYDPATGTFTSLASTLSVARMYHAAAPMADGRVLIFGGESQYLTSGTVEVFDPATQSFSLLARMGLARVHATATLLTTGGSAGKVLIFGGGATNSTQSTAELSP